MGVNYYTAAEPLTPLPFRWNDGGRGEAGYRGGTGDCAVRAAAIATGQPYKEVYRQFRVPPAQRSSGPFARGVSTDVLNRFLDRYGFQWHSRPVQLCKEHLPSGTIVVRMSERNIGHVFVVIDHIINDTYDAARGGIHCLTIDGWFSNGTERR